MATKIYAAILITLVIGLIGGYLVGYISQQDQDSSFEEEIDAKNQQIASLETEVQSLEDQIETKDELIDNLQAEVQSIEGQIEAKSSQISSLQTEVQSLNNQISTKIAQIANLEAEIQSLNNQISTKNQQIAVLEAEVDSMRVSVEVEQVAWDAAADTASVTLRNTGGVNVIVGSISLKETPPEASWYTDTSAAATGNANVGESKVFVWDGGTVGFDLLASTSYVVQANYSSNYVIQYLGETPAG